MSAGSPHPSRCCFPRLLPIHANPTPRSPGAGAHCPTSHRRRETFTEIPSGAGKRPQWLLLSPRAPALSGPTAAQLLDGWDRLAPGAAGPLPWQWQDIAFLQPPRSHKASRRLQLCLAHGDVRRIPRAPGFPPSPAGNPLPSMRGRSSGSRSSLPLSHGWKTPGLRRWLLLLFQVFLHPSLLFLISSIFFIYKLQPFFPVFFSIFCL